MQAIGRRLHFYGGNCYRFATIPWRQREIAPEEARTIFGCSFGSDGWNHLRSTLEEYDHNRSIHYTETTLYRFLTRFTPASICDLVARRDSCEDALPLFVYPWGTFRKGQTVTNRDAALSRFCGPSSDAFVAAELERTIDLYQQLRRTGYQPWRYGNTFIGGTFLRSRDGARRFVVLQGNHRLAVLAHLGVRTIAVRDLTEYLPYVDEADLHRWPLVRDGRCSPETARRVFRMYFDENGLHVLRRMEPADGDRTAETGTH